jgi:Ser/Thr protein kinase RdoA (MazF antagonist)
MFDTLLSTYGLATANTTITAFGSGLINNTWLVNSQKGDFILQRINNHIFKQPADIASNITLIAKHLATTNANYFFVKPCKTLDEQEIIHLETEGFFRMFPFVQHSHTLDVVNSAQEAYEAAKQFGRFTKILVDFPVVNLKITLPNFHNLTLRFQQFEEALENGNPQRIQQSAESIDFLQGQKNIVNTFKQISRDENCKQRVTHHDTKISNVLFDPLNKGICVIDLDTVMPGFFISDVGDMMRTYLSPVSEEERDLEKIEIRVAYFKAIADGYLSEMKDVLTDVEKTHFVYAGKFMIYMQALRFLTDHLKNDVYYGAKYENHNLIRANNQIVLLQKLVEKEDTLNKLLTID